MSRIKETSTNFENKNFILSECNETFAISVIRGQWTLLLCCQISLGKKRFSELRTAIPNITDRMLAHELKRMEQNKLITRTVYKEVPLRVEYELTSIAKELIPILEELGAWGKQHRGEIAHNQMSK